MGYRELQGIQGLTRSYLGLQGVSRGYRGLQVVARAYKGLKGVTGGYRGVVYVNIYVYRPHPPCLYYRAYILAVMLIEYTCLHEPQWCVC